MPSDPVHQVTDITEEGFVIHGIEVDGLLLHVGRPSDRGLARRRGVESREHRQRYDDEVIGPMMASDRAFEAAWRVR